MLIFTSRHDRLKPGNSGSCRRDDGPTARESNPHRIKKQERIIAIEPHNKKKQPIENPIPAQIKAQLPAQQHAMLHTPNPKRNHKNTRRNTPHSHPERMSAGEP